jgi:hypothetical protein
MDKPTYYTIIPAEVRYNKKISANEKVLYSEIFTLAQKGGTCFASNGFFADLYGVHKTTISKWISTLKEHKLIKISYNIESGKVEKRIITPLARNANPPTPKRQYPLAPNAKYNNTRYNNKGSDKEEIILGEII